jgi:5'(3')-deoxyribonucleotidase
MRILVDMDGVCCDYIRPWLEIYNRDYNDDLCREDLVVWGIHELVKPECGRKIYDYLGSPNFYAYLEPLPDVSEVVSRLLTAGHELIIVTADVFNSTTALFDKRGWVERHLPLIPKRNVIGCHRKELIRGDLLFDDGPHNLESFPGLTCAMDLPHNQQVEVDFRVCGWLEFEQLIKDLES